MSKLKDGIEYGFKLAAIVTPITISIGTLIVLPWIRHVNDGVTRSNLFIDNHTALVEMEKANIKNELRLETARDVAALRTDMNVLSVRIAELTAELKRVDSMR